MSNEFKDYSGAKVMYFLRARAGVCVSIELKDLLLNYSQVPLIE